MRKALLFAAALLLTAQAVAQSALPAVDVTAAEIKAFIDALPNDAISDRPIRVVTVGNGKAGVYGVFRPQSLPGDVVIIPPNVPHWWSSLDSDIRYLIFRPDPEGLQPLR